MAIENAIITLQYGFVTEFVQNEIEKKYHRDIVHNVLSGMLGKEEMEEAANLLEIHSEEYYRVVTFYTFQKERGDMYTSEQLRETGIIEGEIMTLCPGQHVYRNIDQIVMIQRVDEKQKREVYLNKMEEMCAALQRIRSITAITRNALTLYRQASCWNRLRRLFACKCFGGKSTHSVQWPRYKKNSHSRSYCATFELKKVACTALRCLDAGSNKPESTVYFQTHRQYMQQILRL